MVIKNAFKKNEETILIIVGSLLLIISFILFHYNKIEEVNNQIYNSIQTEIYKENTTLNNISINVDVDYIESNDEIEKNENNSNYTPNYIAFLEIDKINLKQGLLSKDSYYNNVDYRIEILDISDYPNIVNGNFVLASHSGTSSVSHFKNLYKLNLKDIAKVYYQGKVYKYSIVNIYNQEKDGSIDLYRHTDKTTMTFITCTKNDKNSQTIYILELIGVESY